MSTTANHPMIGRELGNYRVLALLGEGGMGAVFAGEHRFLENKVAIKLLHTNVANDPIVAQRFFQEAKASIAIVHPNVIRVLDFGQSNEGALYLVMELLEGASLGDALATNGPFDERQTARMAETMCDALAAAHALGITHRDLKPDNVFITRDQELKILDFGIAKVAHAGSGTQTGSVMGTPMYMAPEQCKDAKQVGPAADIYAMGVILFQLLTGRPPFQGEFMELLAKHLFESPPRPSSLAKISPEMEVIILQCLEKEPNARPPSMAALRDRLARLTTIDEGPAAIKRPALPLSRSLHRTSPSRRHATPLSIAFIVSAIAVATIAFLHYRHPIADSKTKVDGGAPNTMRDATTELRAAIAISNPMLNRSGLLVERHEVTRHEYAQYVLSLPEKGRATARPLNDWPDHSAISEDTAKRPVTWITEAQAAAFCAAIGARLPTSEEWSMVADSAALAARAQAAPEEFAIGRGSAPTPSDVESAAGDSVGGVHDLLGNVKEWTASIEDGFAEVRGADVSTRVADSKDALTRITQKAVAAPGSKLAMQLIAGERLGFRCLR